MLSLPVLYALLLSFFFFFFNDTATTEIYTLSLHDALPIWPSDRRSRFVYSIPWLISTAIPKDATAVGRWSRSEEHTSELQSLTNLVCRLLLEKKKKKKKYRMKNIYYNSQYIYISQLDD